MRSRMPEWSNVTALFGGAFDPPHLGHVEAVKGLFREPGVKQVFILPTGIPALKDEHGSMLHRATLCKLAFENHPFPGPVRIDQREIEGAARGEVSYTFKTLQSFGRTITPVAVVIGTDQFLDLHRWNQFPELLALSHWILLARRPFQNEAVMKRFNEFSASGLIDRVPGSDQKPAWRVRGADAVLQLTPTEAPALSSTEIRAKLAKTGEIPPGTLPPEVERYLKETHLYGTR